MNKSILRTIATLGLSALLVPLASAQSSIHVNVPFDFTVGKSTLPAGEYRILQVVPSVLEIQRFDGKSAIMTGTLPAQSNKSGDSRLTFNRYGDHYFLAGVSGSDHVWKLPKAAVERELIAKAARPSPISVVASLQK